MQTNTAPAALQFPGTKILVLGFDADAPLRAQYMDQAEFWDPQQVRQRADIPKGIGLITIYSHIDESEIRRVKSLAASLNIPAITDGSMFSLRETLKRKLPPQPREEEKNSEPSIQAAPIALAAPVTIKTQLGEFTRANYNPHGTMVADEGRRVAALYKEKTGTTVSHSAVTQHIYTMRKKTVPALGIAPAIDVLVRNLQSMLEQHIGQERALVLEIATRCQELESEVRNTKARNRTLEYENEKYKSAQETLTSIQGLLRKPGSNS
ncbi:MAG: hypothetical protein KW788_05045 [Candidatus Doudnabacteria bacterium]|nr:hypothetical protein [Candidatus Doudnabacteria bacterium]